MDRILVIEYPKSGGTWFGSLLGDALSLPKRDIYVKDGYKAFDVSKHPWYEGANSLDLTDSCIIKSHELPGSPLHDFEATLIHLIRDGRDVIISKYFYERDFCVRNGIYTEFNVPFDDYLKKTSIDWSHFVLAWLSKDILLCRYEDLLGDTYSSMIRILVTMGREVPEHRIRNSIEANSKNKMKKALAKTFNYNTFVRKGISGDWKNYFNRYHKEVMKRHAGEALMRAGYERDLNW